MRRRRTVFSRLGVLSVALLIAMCVAGVAYAPWMDEVHIEQRVTTGSWDLGGSMGFWRNWRNHYTEAEMAPWLHNINAGSSWLGPTTVAGLDQLFAASGGPGATPRSRFLAHYMATRLSIAAGRLNTASTHDITGIAGHEYLGLADPSSATLSEIVVAIEGKHPADPEAPGACWPNAKQYEILKDVCDAINSLQT